MTKPDFKAIDVFDLQWVADPQIAPDGRSIAYVRMSMDIKTDRSAAASIWLTGIDGKNARPLSDAAASGMPRWSPDGTRIAYLVRGERRLDAAVRVLVRQQRVRPDQPFHGIADEPRVVSGWPLARLHDARARGAKTLEGRAAAGAQGSLLGRPAEAHRSGRVSDRWGGLLAGELHSAVRDLRPTAARRASSRTATSTMTVLRHGVPTAMRSTSPPIDAPDGDYEPLDSEIYRVDLADGSMHALTDRRGPDTHPVVSPDGKHIAYLGFDDQQARLSAHAALRDGRGWLLIRAH